MALMPALGALAPDRLVAIGRGLGVAALVLVPVLASAGRVVPPLLARVARTRDQELFLLVALAIGLGTAALTQAVGLSLALGAFLAGLLISTSDFAHETLARLLPLRDTFGAFFFVTVGALIDPARLVANVPLLLTMVLLVVLGKLVVRAGVVWMFGESLRTALLTGIGLAQIGEFSFVLVQAARQVRAAVRNIRTLNPTVPILARTHERAHHEALRQAGATEVIQPELEAATTLIRHALRRLSLPRESVLAYLEQYRDALELAPA